jgi:hypothetical protein
MSGHRWRPSGVVLLAVAMVVVAAHVIALRSVASHAGLPAAMVLGVIALVAIQHLGLVRRLGGWLRRGPRDRTRS